MGMWLRGHSTAEEEGEAARGRSQQERRSRAIEVGGESCCSGPSRSLPELVQVSEAGFRTWVPRMTRGKQKIEAQKRAAERNEKPKGSQIEARSAGLKTVCTVCKAPLANYKQLVDHFGSKHPKEEVPPAPSS